MIDSPVDNLWEQIKTAFNSSHKHYIPTKMISQDLTINARAKLFRISRSLRHTMIFQNDLNELVLWEKAWSMEFHPEKSCELPTKKINRPTVRDLR